MKNESDEDCDCDRIIERKSENIKQTIYASLCSLNSNENVVKVLCVSF